MRLALFFLLLIVHCCAVGQNMDELNRDLTTLTSAKFAGRGYVKNGLAKASKYIQKRLDKIGVECHTQKYSFQVNTFPKRSKISLGDQKLSEGADIIIDPRSGGFQGEAEIIYIDSASLLSGTYPVLQQGQIPVINTKGIETPEEVNVQYDFVKKAIENSPVILLKEKLTWSVGQQTYEFPIIEILEGSYPKNSESVSIKISPEMIDFEAENLIAKIEGQRSDSSIVFSAHFDHIGKMGKATFPGASDNASGTSMVMDLARYYAQNKPEFDTYFLFFSGEEAGLRGSYHFVNNPTFDLSKVKFLLNLDLMGSAEKGITVVNGRLYEDKMKGLATINTENQFVPKIKLRGKAANSDHYWFSEAGVPAVFIYTEGNITAYHDIYDTAEVVDWANYEGVFTLLVEFVKTL
ncbi:MAG: M28 family metallopeptidase [Bacteroidota bacterium]